MNKYSSSVERPSEINWVNSGNGFNKLLKDDFVSKRSVQYFIADRTEESQYSFHVFSTSENNTYKLNIRSSFSYFLYFEIHASFYISSA